ncbi:MAG: phosphoserine transaminase [Pseudomonadota bacterium]|nr:phosphoserine transaminase [Pseudomonadota bacterium]
MNSKKKPKLLPERPLFSSGPCPKRPGWSFEAVAEIAWLGRSHRGKGPKDQIRRVINLSREILKVPRDYRIGIVPASDTGAFEMSLWGMLGSRPVDLVAWESFGLGWVEDVVQQLKLSDCRIISAEYGNLPNLDVVDPKSDICFTWNGTTSGVKVPNLDWISSDQEGLVFCDATSAVFSHEVVWDKLDVVTFSWQKTMGGEGAHGMLILSPKAIHRLENYTPDRPLPKIFRLTKNGRFLNDIFLGNTINTPSMLCVADALDSLQWIDSIGGVAGTIKRTRQNFELLQSWVDKNNWIENLAQYPDQRSNSSVCLKFVEEKFIALDEVSKQEFVQSYVDLLEREGAAFDIKSHRDAPPGLRVWCGATVESEDIRRLLPWLKWAYVTTCERKENFN